MIEPNQNRAKPSLEYISWGMLHLKLGIISTERLVGDIFLDICCDINTHSSYCIGCQNVPLSLAKRAHCYKKVTDTGKRGIEKIWDHNDVIKWKHFPPHWPFMRAIHRWIPTQRPETGSFDVFFDLCLKKTNKKWWGWLFETPSCPLWRHCYVFNCLSGVRVWSSNSIHYFVPCDKYYTP